VVELIVVVGAEAWLARLKSERINQPITHSLETIKHDRKHYKFNGKNFEAFKRQSILYSAEYTNAHNEISSQ
jgi:hypothetical protein